MKRISASKKKRQNKEMIFYVDTETTGLPRKKFLKGKSKMHYRDLQAFDEARLVSIAWVLEAANGSKINRSYLVRPEGFEIPAVATGIHGITTEMALANGVEFATMAVQLDEDLADTELLVAHNVEFDKAILKSELFRRGNLEILRKLKASRKYCTMRNAQTLLRLAKWPRLPDLYLQLTGKTAEPAKLHSAQGDVLYCYECYGILKERFASVVCI